MDLINTLVGRLLIGGFAPSHLIGFSKKTKKKKNKSEELVFTAFGIQSGHVKRESVKFAL